jgi:hypothetical protein
VAGRPVQQVGEPDDHAHQAVAREAAALRVLGNRPRDAPSGHVGQPRREPVDLLRRDAEGLRHVPERGPSLERVVGADHRHPVVAVALVDLLHHLVAAVPGEVDVDVRAVLPREAQEPLEGQVVLDRVDDRDAERVGDEAVRRGAAPHRRDPLRPGPPDDVPDDEEVLREPELLDDRELVLETADDVRPDRPVARRRPLEAELPEIRERRLPLRQREAREDRARPGERHVAALRQPDPVRERLGEPPERPPHLRRRRQVRARRNERPRRKIVADETAPADGVDRPVEHRAGAPVGPVGRPRRHRRQPEPLRQGDEVGPGMSGQRHMQRPRRQMRLEVFHERRIRDEQRRPLDVPGPELRQPERVRMEAPGGHEAADRAVSGFVASQREERTAALLGVLMKPRAEDPADARLLRHLQEADGAVEGVVVGQRHRGDPARSRGPDDVRQARHPPQQREVRVDLEQRHRWLGRRDHRALGAERSRKVVILSRHVVGPRLSPAGRHRIRGEG